MIKSIRNNLILNHIIFFNIYMDASLVAIICVLALIVIAVFVAYIYLVKTTPPPTPPVPFSHKLTSIVTKNIGLDPAISIIFTADPREQGLFYSDDQEYTLLTYKGSENMYWYAVICTPNDIKVLDEKTSSWGGFGVICLNADPDVDMTNVYFVQCPRLKAGVNVVDTPYIQSTTLGKTTRSNLVVFTTSIGTAGLSWGSSQ
jgi:hypothetical protein